MTVMSVGWQGGADAGEIGDRQIGCGVELIRGGAIRVRFGFLAEPFIEAGSLGEGV